jgi:hypothetical protein
MSREASEVSNRDISMYDEAIRHVLESDLESEIDVTVNDALEETIWTTVLPLESQV